MDLCKYVEEFTFIILNRGNSDRQLSVINQKLPDRFLSELIVYIVIIKVFYIYNNN